MDFPAESLTPAQHEAAHAPASGDAPLVVLGGAGTGKTGALVSRFAALVAAGVAPEAVLALAAAPPAAEALRARIEAAVEPPYEELHVTTLGGLCERMLRDEALEAGLDPFLVPVDAGDRLAMLLDRIDELPLRRHDMRGNPAALLASFVTRIDRLKDQLVSPDEYAGWAARLPEDDESSRARAVREREFAEIYRQHDRMLAERGALDGGDLLARSLRLLRERPDVRARIAARYPHVLVDDYEELGHAHTALLGMLADAGAALAVGADDDGALTRFRAAAAKNVSDLLAERPGARVVSLERSLRCPERVLAAAGSIVAPIEGRLGLDPEPRAEGGEVAFWRAANDRAQAQAAAAEIERLITREGVPAERICVLVHSVAREGQDVAVALEERSLRHRVLGAAALFQRAEVRDVLAWLRLLADPGDAGAVVRALARPPIELRSIDLARCTQIARRRKLDMVGALVAATESPQIPPEARERILRFLKLHRQASAALDTTRPDMFVHRLIDRLGLRRRQLFAAQPDVVERLVQLARFSELAADHVRREPQATAREFAHHIAAVAEAGLREEEIEPGGMVPGAVAVMAMSAAKGLEFDHVFVLGLHAARMPGARKRALEPIPDALLREELPPDSRELYVASMRRLLRTAVTRARERVVLAYPRQSGSGGSAQQPSPFVEEVRAALGAEWEDHEEQLFGPGETLHATYRMLRDELLETVSRVGGRLGELRFDTDLDISHAVVRYLELVKVASLIQRSGQQGPAEALPEINSRLLQAVTAEQREILETSALDEYLLDVEHHERRRELVAASRDEPSLEAFLPRRGDGLVLSAGDIETYRTCPLKYKFARVFRIPTEPTLNQRFGILVHQVLERFHAAGGSQALAELLGLLDAGWRRGGFGDSEEERQLQEKARNALTRYWEGLRGEDNEPVWFERSFEFKLDRHLVRGRVDRVDRMPDGGFELIDYKTGRPKSVSQLRDDVQLSLYAVGAREAWRLESSSQAYLYVLDNEKVPVPRDEDDRDAITETVARVAEGIEGQGFEPTPTYSACSICDFRLICPAAER